MKKLVLMLMQICFFLSLSEAQQVEYTAKNTCLKTGDILVDGYYGFPFINAILFQNMLYGSTNTSVMKNTNHIGLRGELMVEERVSMGAEITYAQAEINYLSYQSSGTQVAQAARISKLRALMKFNFHFKLSPNFDPYITSGLGFKKNGYYTSGMVRYDQGLTLPIAFRLGGGVRYFLSKSLAVNMEAGIGGPLVQFGLSVKP